MIADEVSTDTESLASDTASVQSTEPEKRPGNKRAASPSPETPPAKLSRKTGQDGNTTTGNTAKAAPSSKQAPQRGLSPKKTSSVQKAAAKLRSKMGSGRRASVLVSRLVSHLVPDATLSARRRLLGLRGSSRSNGVTTLTSHGRAGLKRQSTASSKKNDTDSEKKKARIVQGMYYCLPPYV